MIVGIEKLVIGEVGDWGYKGDLEMDIYGGIEWVLDGCRD